jgi:hypothetical protein
VRLALHHLIQGVENGAVLWIAKNAKLVSFLM